MLIISLSLVSAGLVPQATEGNTPPKSTPWYVEPLAWAGSGAPADLPWGG